ncbi:11414_t:CDS:2 [Dentiscutata erythropus]|uniref:11414_t:CDS:1 n=1 Tax=Dentiscutata erythropus TaxID=1348616 RepID=A0A9N9G058_9GLOM|nr:11414_t:CDS:2 [Dentiscutata erythropus]
MIQDIKNAIDNWLYLNDKIYEQAIRKELEALCLDKMILPTVNLESSESEIISWKVSEEVQWCFENLDSIVEQEDKTHLQIVAIKVFGQLPTKNQFAVTQAMLYNLFNPEIVQIKFDERYLT